MGRGNQESVRRRLRAIFDAAIAAVEPERLVRERLVGGDSGLRLRLGPKRSLDLEVDRIFLVAAGKAAIAMARAATDVLGPRLAAGLVVSHQARADLDRRLRFVTAGHPVPDRRSAAAGSLALAIARRARANDRLLVLLSGGASSLLVAPARGISLADKARTNQLLLASGASIAEINAVRKHLSRIKGGALARASRAPVLALSLSDVIGSSPSVIGSGPAAPDPSTFADAWRVLERHEIVDRVQPAVRRRLDAGRRGRLAETAKPGELAARNVVIGDNRHALTAAAEYVRSLGIGPEVLTTSLREDVASAAAWLGARIRSSGRGVRPICLLAGGETTVEVRGTGRGGRNQQLALLLAREISGSEAHALCAGSDGRDGPTDAAGAFVDGGTWQRALRAGLDPATFLARDDSHGFFGRAGGLLRTGATGTNVMDLVFVLLGAAGQDPP